MEYTFKFRCSENEIPVQYFGADSLSDKASIEYMALHYGNDLIDKFKEYYEVGYKRKIPRPHLFAISSQNVNAFAVFEKGLDEYCIGINLGTFQRIKDKTEEIVNMVVEKCADESIDKKLILPDEKDKWIDAVYISATRFFVAHEYAHILNGHVEEDSAGYFEFVDEEMGETDNIFQQMKEFDADETAMNILCYMARCSSELKYHMQSDILSKKLYKNSQYLKKARIPEALINLDAQRHINALIQAADKKTIDIRHNFKQLMLGVNVVFLTLDDRREKYINYLADEQKISYEDRSKFYFLSGLQLIRAVNHPIPALRLDAVIRIIDEYIENIEGADKADEICKDIADYVWKVEFLRCNGDASKLYIHVAHTPTAQDFIQEVENRWQKERKKFKSYIDQLERLFYVNRIIDMSDDGILI